MGFNPKPDKPSLPPDARTLAAPGMQEAQRGAAPGIPEAKPGAPQGTAGSEKFDTLAEKHAKRLGEIFDAKISAGNLLEQGNVALQNLKTEQINRLRGMVALHKREFISQSKVSANVRAGFAQELLSKADSEAQNFVEAIDRIIKLSVKGEYFTLEEAARLRNVLAGVEAEAMADRKVSEILRRLQENKKLTDADYEKIISIMKPYDFTKVEKSPGENFDASSVGLLVGFMKPDQRLELMDRFIKSPRNEEFPLYLDGMLRTGTLSVRQGRELFDRAVNAKIVTEKNKAQFKEISTRLGTDFYQTESKKVRDAIQTQIERIKSMMPENMVDRIVGGPLLGAGMVLHAILWLFTNVLACAGEFKAIMQNPCVGMAIGEGMLGAEIASGSMKKGAPYLGVGSGMVSGFFDRMLAEDRPKNEQEVRAWIELRNVYINYPDLGDYLVQGGAQTILKVRKEKDEAHKKDEKVSVIITTEDLMHAERETGRYGQIEDIQKKFSTDVNRQINLVAELMPALGISRQDQFNYRMAQVHELEGLGKLDTKKSTGVRAAIAPSTSGPAKKSGF